MMEYTLSCYQPLLPGSDRIRLLRLLPHEDGNAPVQCELFDYTLQESHRRTHPYDALSYAWGDWANPKSISISGHNVIVTQNLYMALLRLRHSSIERILWVDAICINQSDKLEKEQQIGFMAKIYAQANRVVVWLGEGTDDSDQALEEIRIAGGGKMTSSSSSPEVIHKAVLTLLQRPWFRRIWVLQEVAAARHILIICGSAEIDGYAFSLGVGSPNIFNADPDVQSLIRSVTYLIRGAIFRPGYSASISGRPSLDICSLGELIDMYHAHEATELHDKVFALLGMSSDNLSKANLSPNYALPWKGLFQNLVKFLIYDKISVEALDYKQIALIRSKGCILGKVSSVQSGDAWSDSQDVNLLLNDVLWQAKYNQGWNTHWTLHTSAIPIRSGDLVCLLQGASKPTIIRLHDNHFDIIMSSVTPPEAVLKILQSIKKFSCSFSLVWDWENSPKELQHLEQHEALLQTQRGALDSCEIELGADLERATRTWKVAMALAESDELERAEEKIQEALKIYEMAAVGGQQAMIQHLLSIGEIDIDIDSRDNIVIMPLWWAARGGHEIMVKLLLSGDNVEVDSKHTDRTTPLWWAAKGGHLAVVERLLQEKAEVNAVARSNSGITVLQAAAGGGHLSVVERLLQEKAEVNARAGYHGGRTALQAAAGEGHLAVLERLLQEGADINAAAGYDGGRTSLQAAAEGGHLAVVERLLREGADVNAAAGHDGGRTALQAAAEGGHLTVVNRLLEEGADVNAPAGYDGKTALEAAVEGEHLAVVERLLQAGADLDTAAGYDVMTVLNTSLKGDYPAIRRRPTLI